MKFEVEIPITAGPTARDLYRWLCENIGVIYVDWSIGFNPDITKLVIKCREPHMLVMIKLRWS